ncbi:hypothetical protein ACETK8_14300 [Brevundimonas staleyi]|jgi:hypothetical protein|uniref:Uncharacterized protein n=1 Tax=Brevundimonas staleyi TaxID=74326 RepID=A0ABW0FWP1_9CAUL
MTSLRTGARIARKLQDTEHAVDRALIATSDLIKTLIEGRLEVGVAAQSGHDALIQAVGGLNGLSIVRGQLIASHDELKALAEAAGIPYRMEGTMEPKVRPTGRLALVPDAA